MSAGGSIGMVLDRALTVELLDKLGQGRLLFAAK